MKILITGGAGFIGSRMTELLLNRGHEITIVDSLSDQVHAGGKDLSEQIKGRVKFIRGDVRNRSLMSDAIKMQDVVVHLAAETGTGQSMYEIEKYSDVNIGGTAILLDLLANDEHSVKKVVVASSRAIYGEGKYSCTEHGVVYPGSRLKSDMEAGDFYVKCPVCKKEATMLPTDEESRLSPDSVYGITKQTQEQMVLVTCRSLGIPALAYRYQNVYGPGQSLSNPYTGILSIFSTRIMNNKDIQVFEDGNEGRDFVYIDDVADATIRGIEDTEFRWEALNVGSGVCTTVKEVAETLVSAYGRKHQTNIEITGSFRLGDIRNNVADMTKISKIYNFKPQTSFREGILIFTRWVESQKTSEDRLDESLNEMKSRGLFKQ